MARPVLERLHDKLDGATTLGRLDGQHVVYVDQVRTSRSRRCRPGRSRRTARRLGKMILSQLEPDELRALYPQERLDQLTARSISSRTALEEELRLARAARVRGQRRGAAARGHLGRGRAARPRRRAVRDVRGPAGPADDGPAPRGGAVRALTGAAAELSGARLKLGMVPAR